MVKHAPPADVDWKLGVSDGRYHRVKGLPFIDGVFVPDDRRGPVQLDSAGHSFADFGTSDDSVFDYLWAGGELPAPIRPTFTRLGFIDDGQPDTSAVLGSFGIPEHSARGTLPTRGLRLIWRRFAVPIPAAESGVSAPWPETPIRPSRTA